MISTPTRRVRTGMGAAAFAALALVGLPSPAQAATGWTSDTSNIAFGTTFVGGSKEATITLTNNGVGTFGTSQSTSLRDNGSGEGSSNATVTRSNNTCGSLFLPHDFATGESCTVTLKFAPTAAGSISGTYKFSLHYTQAVFVFPNFQNEAASTDFAVTYTGSGFKLVLLPPGPGGGGNPNVPAPSTCAGLTATIVGTAGNDGITGTDGDDIISAGPGDDIVAASGGKDIVCGGDGNDILQGGGANDKLFGEAGNDTLRGGGGKDVCKGGPGTDKARKCEKVRSVP